MSFRTVGFIGAGNMAYAIVSGICSSSILPAQSIMVADISPQQLERFTVLGCKTASAQEIASTCDAVFLSVKPQNFATVLPEIAGCLSADKLVVTIAAGISISYIKQTIGKDVPVVRVLPNVPMLMSEGASVLASEPPVSDEQFDFVRSVFESCGKTAVIDESLMNDSVFLHSSSPAVIFRIADTIVKEAAASGIDSACAVTLFAQTLRGCALMIEQPDRSCEELARMVTSPGGTTLAALNVLEENAFFEHLTFAMRACKNRADELGK